MGCNMCVNGMEVQRHKNIQIFLPPRTTDNKLLGILENKETTWKKYSSTKNRIMHAEILYSFSLSLTHSLETKHLFVEFLIRNEIRNRLCSSVSDVMVD